MISLTDFTFEKGNLNTTEKISGNKAILNAIKNIILSRPGNFPYTPELGIDLDQYQFEIADNVLINKVKGEIESQISRYIPEINSFSVNVSIIDYDIQGLRKVLCISVNSSYIDGEETIDFLTYRDKYNNLKIIENIR